MNTTPDSTHVQEINAALFCGFADHDFMADALVSWPEGRLLISDDPALLPEIPASHRTGYAKPGLQILPFDPEDTIQRLRDLLAGQDGLQAVLVDMTWASMAMMGVAAIEQWGNVAERISAETGLSVISLYNRQRLIEEQLLSAFRAHQHFLAPSGLYENPYWMPRELLHESTLDEQLGFMLGRVVPDFAGQSFFRTFDKAAARGASPDWLDDAAPPLVTQGNSERWHIHCLGQLRVFVAGQHEVDWRIAGGAPKKTKTLFAYLLNAGEKGAHADQIGELLWQGDETEKTKRARLHHTVAMLRKVLGSRESVIRTGDYYRLNAPPGSLVDITTFEQLCRRALSLARHGKEDAALVVYFEAERLYAGDLFEDLPLEYLATETEDWIMPRRTWLREMAMRVHYDLSKLLRRYRRYAEALEWSQRAIAIDPTSEAANAEAMRVFHAMGRPDAMHRQYRQYRKAMSNFGEEHEGIEIRAVYDELCRSLDRLTPGQRKTKELVLR
ncbi:response regulator [Rhodobacter sp. NTK016B]|uniref:BTAD domain-containing putative transcriptional regulator n=1 Tax=Rhodobacter sp. NTK016B TaxID=2759676 RepID=UPI001A8E2963|nr:BTAD domain-containing putative transcriptional regulator [Rhodobacter sp. NTK016B]MBN8292941.1 response regulator [Rhodobacter sp. NTK016B]